MPRNYTKRDQNYWDSLSAPTSPPADNQPVWRPETAGDPYYLASASVLKNVAKASIGGRSSMDSSASTGFRVNAAAITGNPDRFSAIRAGLLPYEYSRDGVSVRDAIELCQKAYANVAVFANAIDLMSEFANTEIFFEGGTKKGRQFFEAWLKKIKIWKICDQYFREYYRSGNVFIYRIEGRFDTEDYMKLTQVYGAAGEADGENKIPLKYIFLNPYGITAKTAATFTDSVYEYMLSKYDLEKLKAPQTEEDKEIAENLPSEAKKALADKSYTSRGIKIPLDAKSVITSFSRKQDYEPFAIPFGYRVLEDINAKLELKKMDQAILRTVENAILLITMGAKPDEGGINQANLAAMQNLFKNESVGRVLISDWTTKAEFIIPDLKKVLGPEKYETLNRDISEGLQNVIIGEEKYGNTQTKVQVFLEKLRESRNTFLNDVLQPEIKRIARSLGMRKIPNALFKSIDSQDKTQMQRVITRMMELGLLDVKSGISAINNNKFPDVENEEFLQGQEDYVKERKRGLWNPLSPVATQAQPAPPLDPNAKYSIDNRAPASPTPTQGKKPKTMKGPGREKGQKTAKASVLDIQSVVYETENLLHEIEGMLMDKYESTNLSAQQKDAAESLMKSVVCASSKNEWSNTARACIEDNSLMLGLNTRSEVLDVAAEHDLEDYDAALFFEAQV